MYERSQALKSRGFDHQRLSRRDHYNSCTVESGNNRRWPPSLPSQADALGELRLNQHVAVRPAQSPLLSSHKYFNACAYGVELYSLVSRQPTPQVHH
jgi:hypothetical protein